MRWDWAFRLGNVTSMTIMRLSRIRMERGEIEKGHKIGIFVLWHIKRREWRGIIINAINGLQVCRRCFSKIWAWKVSGISTLMSKYRINRHHDNSHSWSFRCFPHPAGQNQVPYSAAQRWRVESRRMCPPRVEPHDLNVRFTRKRYSIIIDLGSSLFSRGISIFILLHLIIKTSKCIHIRLLRFDRNIVISFGIIALAVPE